MKIEFIILSLGLLLFGCNKTEQVATPTATPDAGSIIPGTEITLACATEGATIHYTLDGNIPTSNSAIYTTPIVINEVTVIKAIAVKSEMDNSEVLTADYSMEVMNKTYTVNGATFAMIYVQGGTFDMGATPEQPQDENDPDWNRWFAQSFPVHTVTLSNDYYVGETEITQALYEAVMGESITQIMEEYELNPYGIGDNYPMYHINWDDVIGTNESAEAYTINGITYYQNGFCYKLSQLTDDGKQFRLPTEAEWEYAARGGNVAKVQTRFPGSNNVDDVAWYWDNVPLTDQPGLVVPGETGHRHTQPVATKQPNALGIYDMGGNLPEWCSDWWGEYSSDSQTDPTGPSSGTFRVSRCGRWDYEKYMNCISYRDHGTSTTGRTPYLGFRLVMSY